MPRTIVFLLVTSLVDFVRSQNPYCDFSQYIVPGQTYNIQSPNYPNSYPPGAQCRWQTTCPANYNCRLLCSDIDIPQSTSCTVDRLMVSRTGDPTLAGADKYCGRGTLDVNSVEQRLSLGLISSQRSNGGRFNCTVTAKLSSNPQPTCNCGFKKGNRIVGGQTTGVNEYPMMAGIVDVGTEEIYCGAVIIYDRYLLTAAHCLTQRVPSGLAIVVGEHNPDDATNTRRRIYGVSDFLIHPLFNANYDYDIALIETATPMQFSDAVLPVCLPFKLQGSSFENSVVTALGFGTEFFGGPKATALQKVQLNVISQNTCRPQVQFLTNRQMCTLTPGKDACQFDSGGPLLYTDPQTGRLYNIGIISNGISCATGKPGINTRVTELLYWITSNTPSANYCRI